MARPSAALSLQLILPFIVYWQAWEISSRADVIHETKGDLSRKRE
jgi:hypothetical protein